MANSDPKKIRTFGQTSERRNYEAEEDPLVELARIVSEDSGFATPKPERTRLQSQQSPQREERVERNSYSGDLEAELLQELETSFSARPTPAPTTPVARTALPPVRTAPPPAPQAQEPQQAPAPANDEDDPDDLLRAIEEQLGQFERRAYAMPNPAPVPEPVEEPPVSTWARQRAAARDDAPAGAHDAEAEGSWLRRRNVDDMPQEERIEPVPPEQQEWQPAPRRAPEASSEYRFRGPAAKEGRDGDRWTREPRNGDVRSNPELRGSYRDAPPDIEEADAASVPTPAETRFVDDDPSSKRGQATPRTADRRNEGQSAFAELEQVPPPPRRDGTNLTGVAAQLSKELEPSYADPTFGGHWEEGAAEAATVAEVPAPNGRGRRAVNRAPAAEHSAGSGRWLRGLAAVILVAAIGGGVAYYLRSAEQVPDGPPPVITAPDGPVKIEAQEEQAAAGGDTVGEAVYNRVAGNAPEGEEQIVDNSEEPTEIARVILPPTQEETDGVVRPVGEEQTGARGSSEAQADGGTETPPDEIGPRRVQTFVVRPDGTLMPTSEAGTQSADSMAALEQQMAAETEPIEPVQVPTVAITAEDTALNGATVDAPAPVPDAAPTPVEEAPESPALAAFPEEEELTALQTNEPSTSASEAPVEETAPVDLLTSTEPTVTPPVATAAEEGYFVQVSSQRSRDQAEGTFADLQSRYASVLGGLQATVQEADVPGQGLYYRVRVGPWATRDEAVGVCEALQNAGGSCFVTQ
jgi:cell division protein FtsN